MYDTFGLFFDNLKDVLSLPFFKIAFSVLFIALGVISILILICMISDQCKRFFKQRRDKNNDDN